MKYLAENFEQLMAKSYGFNPKIFNESQDWLTARALYENNYVKSTETVQRIPKKIHQIWLGGDLPEKYLDFTLSWLHNHPTWEYRLWTDEDVKDYPIINRHLFDKATNVGMKSDILRYEILNNEGGLYVDTDFECLRAFDDLLYLDFFTGVSYDDLFVNYIGLIATVPKHPIIQNCINDLKDIYMGRRPKYIMQSTGPQYFTRCFTKYVKEDTTGVVTFPVDFFYPWPNNRIKDGSNAYDFVKPFSYAIHHWAVSWVKNK